jgi:hypothetical protein
MVTFVVFVDGDADGWRVDHGALTSAIRAGWGEVEIDSMPRSEVRAFHWRFETEDGVGEVDLHKKGTCLYMNVAETDAVRLAVLFRRLAPAGLDLVFCDEGYTFDVQLDSEASDAELVDLMNAA